MNALWAALGYEHRLAEITRHFSEGGRTIIVDGPPGVGKSWLAKGFGASWEEGGGASVVAEGDIGRSHFDYYPFGLAMAGLPAGWSTAAAAAAATARAAERIIGTGGLVTTMVQGLARMRKSKRMRQAVFLGEREQQVLASLERLGRNRPILLIADNLHWWDTASLKLLRELVEPVMQETFPFLGELRILGVLTPEPYQETVHGEVLGDVLARTALHRIELDRVPEESFGAVLHALGVDPFPEDSLTSAVFALSGGHLALASRAAVRISADDSSDILAASESHEFMRSLISQRMASLGELGQQAIGLLQIAAVLGLTFRRDEILCAVDDDERSTGRLLRLCRDESLLEFSNGDCRFVHDLYREFFLTAAGADRVEIHERLADCLRELRSGDYDLRAQNALLAEDTTAAAALGAVACLKAAREGKGWSEVSPATLGVVRFSGIDSVVVSLAAAIDHLRRYEHRACLALLDTLPSDLPKMLLAEADYIRSMLLMATRSEEDREQARMILAAWDGYEQQEPEIGTRLSRLLLYGLTHLEDKTAGRDLEHRIRLHLIDRVSIDETARDDLHVLDRCAASLYQPEIAVARNENAVRHFAPEPGRCVVRRPLEYYRSLVNYGAGLTANARYGEASAVYGRVRELVAEYPADTFPRVDYPLSNELAVRFRMGHITAAEAVGEQRRIIDEHGVDSDPFYVRNAVAVYLALSGDAAAAAEVLDGLLQELHTSRAEPESSTIYLLGSNRCCARRVAGAPNLRSEWSALRSIVEDIRYMIRPYLIRRHELLAPVFDDPGPITAADLDAYVDRAAPYEFGPLWKNYNHGFRLAEVEFWREN